MHRVLGIILNKIVAIKTKSSKLKSAWRVGASFQIGLDAKDKVLLDSIKAYFGVGEVYKSEKIYTVLWWKDIKN